MGTGGLQNFASYALLLKGWVRRPTGAEARYLKDDLTARDLHSRGRLCHMCIGEFTKHGQLYCRKVAKNLGRCGIFSAREIEHGQFRALFATRFGPKMQNGRSLPKRSDS